jgi:hypothetical protein
MRPIEQILKMYRVDELAHSAIAQRLGIPAGEIRRILIERGIPNKDISKRSLDTRYRHIAEALGYRTESEIPACEQCTLYLSDNPDWMPQEWAWKISGRRGDLCNACAREMNKLHKERMRKLTGLGCIVCRIEKRVVTPPEIHHLRDGRGVGSAKNHDKTIPLCPIHHRIGRYGIAFHAGQQEWEKRHGRETWLLATVNELLDS